MGKQSKTTKTTLGLALSGGGARGLAHIGFLKVLEREHIHVDYLSGTSMGSVIAAAYARGMSIEDLEREAVNSTTTRNMIRMVSITPPMRGIVESDKLKSVLNHFIPEGVNFEDLRIPTAIAATDLIHSCSVTLNSGPVLLAVMASCAMPGIFPAVDCPPLRLVDGGVLNNLPVNLVRKLGAKRVIAIDAMAEMIGIRPQEEQFIGADLPFPIPGALRDLLWSSSMMVARITQAQVETEKPDLYLRPPIPVEVSMFLGFRHAQAAIDAGERAAEEYLPQIRALLE